MDYKLESGGGGLYSLLRKFELDRYSFVFVPQSNVDGRQVRFDRPARNWGGRATQAAGIGELG